MSKVRSLRPADGWPMRSGTLPAGRFRWFHGRQPRTQRRLMVSGGIRTDRLRQLSAYNGELLAVNARLMRENEALQGVSHQKTEFLTHMSHELRTPLNAVIGFSEILSDGSCGPLDNEQRSYVGHILAGGRQLLTLVDDVLDLARVEAGRIDLHLAELELHPVVDAACAMLVPLAQQNRVKILVEPPERSLRIMADRPRLVQIMHNLLSNAIKFTPDDGLIRVQTGTDGGRAVISVSDNGSGIPTEHLGRIFREYEQVERDDLPPGMGLGLALVRRLAELHGGTITVCSAVDEGSTFRVILPLAHDASARPPEGERAVLEMDSG